MLGYSSFILEKSTIKNKLSHSSFLVLISCFWLYSWFIILKFLYIPYPSPPLTPELNLNSEQNTYNSVYVRSFYLGHKDNFHPYLPFLKSLNHNSLSQSVKPIQALKNH